MGSTWGQHGVMGSALYSEQIADPYIHIDGAIAGIVYEFPSVSPLPPKGILKFRVDLD